jgi:hypothetical protein
VKNFLRQIKWIRAGRIFAHYAYNNNLAECQFRRELCDQRNGDCIIHMYVQCIYSAKLSVHIVKNHYISHNGCLFSYHYDYCYFYTSLSMALHAQKMVIRKKSNLFFPCEVNRDEEK